MKMEWKNYRHKSYPGLRRVARYTDGAEDPCLLRVDGYEGRVFIRMTGAERTAEQPLAGLASVCDGCLIEDMGNGLFSFLHDGMLEPNGWEAMLDQGEVS